MKCLDRHAKYNGLAGRTFNIRYKEHASRNNESNCGCSNPILNTRYVYGVITYTMDIIRSGQKDTH